MLLVGHLQGVTHKNLMIHGEGGGGILQFPRSMFEILHQVKVPPCFSPQKTICPGASMSWTNSKLPSFDPALVLFHRNYETPGR